MIVNGRAIEKELARKSYPEIEKELRPLCDDDLINLLDSRSTKIGDMAADLLSSRDRGELVAEMLLAERLRTQLGRIRGLAILRQRGKGVRGVLLVYLRLIHDRSRHVVEWALFGLAFLQDKSCIPEIEAARDAGRAGSQATDAFDLAIRALREEDPYIYLPDWHDRGNVWGFDESKSKTKRELRRKAGYVDEEPDQLGT